MIREGRGRSGDDREQELMLGTSSQLALLEMGQFDNNS